MHACHLENSRGVVGALGQELGGRDMHETVLIIPHYDFQEILHRIPVVLLFLSNAFGLHLCAVPTNASQIAVSGFRLCTECGKQVTFLTWVVDE